jgi:hypothetical protein
MFITAGWFTRGWKYKSEGCQAPWEEWSSPFNAVMTPLFPTLEVPTAMFFGEHACMPQFNFCSITHIDWRHGNFHDP